MPFSPFHLGCSGTAVVPAEAARSSFFRGTAGKPQGPRRLGGTEVSMMPVPSTRDGRLLRASAPVTRTHSSQRVPKKAGRRSRGHNGYTITVSSPCHHPPRQGDKACSRLGHRWKAHYALVHSSSLLSRRSLFLSVLDSTGPLGL